MLSSLEGVHGEEVSGEVLEVLQLLLVLWPPGKVGVGFIQGPDLNGELAESWNPSHHAVHSLLKIRIWQDLFPPNYGKDSTLIFHICITDFILSY